MGVPSVACAVSVVVVVVPESPRPDFLGNAACPLVRPTRVPDFRPVPRRPWVCDDDDGGGVTVDVLGRDDCATATERPRYAAGCHGGDGIVVEDDDMLLLALEEFALSLVYVPRTRVVYQSPAVRVRRAVFIPAIEVILVPPRACQGQPSASAPLCCAVKMERDECKSTGGDAKRHCLYYAHAHTRWDEKID